MLGKQPILVVDDDPKIVSLICLYLQKEGFQTVTAMDGATALEQVAVHSPALVVLDVMLPKFSGFEVCRRLRRWSNTAILMLTAKTTEEEKLLGLTGGADDYMTKPFSPKELVARIRAILRRAGHSPDREHLLSAQGVTVDFQRHNVHVEGEEVYLTAFEFKLLVTLMSQPGRVFSRERLLASVYSIDELYSVDRTIDVHVGKLRQKIEADTADPQRILTVRGVGYKFRDVEQAAACAP